MNYLFRFVAIFSSLNFPSNKFFRVVEYLMSSFVFFDVVEKGCTYSLVSRCATDLKAEISS